MREGYARSVSNVRFGILVFGGLCEFAGVILTAAPEIYPVLRALRARVFLLFAVARSRIRRLFGRRKTVSGSSHVSGGMSPSGRLSGVVLVGETASDERKLAFLLELAETTQRRLNELESTASDLPRQWKDEIEATKGEIAALIETKLAEERNAYLRSRRLGIILLAIGLPVVFLANFIE
jgi:hypothetical protein